MANRKGKIVWNSPTQSNVQPTIPHTSRGLPSIVSYYERLPRGFSEDSYKNALIPGNMFLVPKGTYLISGVWENTVSDQICYLSRSRYNPQRTINASFKKFENDIMALYTGQKRLTEWDGHGWSRSMRPIFIVEGLIVACLDATSACPIL